MRELERLRSGRLELQGVLRVGDNEIAVSGEYELNGRDFRSVSVLGAGDEASTTVEVFVGGEMFRSEGDGPFFRADEEASGSGGSTGDPQGIVRALRRLRDAGVERRDGQRLHRLVLPPGTTLDPRDLGFADPAMTQVEADVEVFAEPDGAPVEIAFVASWQQQTESGAVPAEMELGYHFRDVGERVVVERPADVWRVHQSERYGYSVGYPEEWDVEEVQADDEADEWDSFLSSEGIEVIIFAEPGFDTVNEYATTSILHWQDQLGTRPEANEPITFGGEAGRLLTYHGELDGTETFLMDAVTVRERRAYSVTWYSIPGDEAAEAERFRLMLSTFAFQ